MYFEQKLKDREMPQKAAIIEACRESIRMLRRDIRDDYSFLRKKLLKLILN